MVAFDVGVTIQFAIAFHDPDSNKPIQAALAFGASPKIGPSAVILSETLPSAAQGYLACGRLDCVDSCTW